MKLLSGRKRDGSTPSDSNRSQPPPDPPAPVMISTGSRVQEVAAIAREQHKRSIAFPLRLHLGHQESNDVETLSGLNGEAERELSRLLDQQKDLIESARRSQLSDGSTAGEHAELAVSHLLQGFARSYDSLGDALFALGACCCAPFRSSSGGPPETPSRKSLTGSVPAAAEPVTPSSRKSMAGAEAKATPIIGGGETAVREAHLMRSIKRSYAKYGATENAEEEAMRLREARARVLEDKAAEEATARLVWCPLHMTRQTWDLSMLTLILYSCVMVPYRIGLDASAEGVMDAFENVVTVLFIVDLLTNFNTAYAEGPHYVLDRGMIARNYVKGWFWIDLPSSFPFEAFNAWLTHILMQYGHEVVAGEDNTNHSASFKLLRALRLFRLLRLLRLLKLQQYIDGIEDRLQINLQVLQIVKMVIGMVYLAHLLGCFWFYIATQHAAGSATWLTVYDGGSGVDASKSVQYLYSVYWALMTLTTVGYGDITPQNNTERSYALFSLLVGALVFGYMLSSIGDLIASLDVQGAAVQEKLDEVKEFTRWHKMPPDLSARVRKYYEFYYARQGPMDEEAIVSNMAPSLNRDVRNHLLAQTVFKVPFFFVPVVGARTDDLDAPADIAFQLAVYPLLKPLVREAKEIVVPKGSCANELIFLNRGQVAAHADMHAPPAGGLGRMLYVVAEQGEFLTQHVLSDAGCDVSWVAHLQRCELFCIEAKELQALMDKFPHARDELAHFCFEDMVYHKKRRNWSLRMMNREAMPLGRDVVSSQIVLHRCALRLQVMWLRRQLGRLETKSSSHYYENELFPLIYGREPKAEIAEIARRKAKRAASRITIETFKGVSQQVGVLPFGGVFTPRIGSSDTAQPSARAVPKGGTLTAAPAASASAGGSSAGSSSSGNPPSSRSVQSQLESMPAGFGALEQRMEAREAQLQTVHDLLAKLVGQSAGTARSASGSASSGGGSGAGAADATSYTA